MITLTRITALVLGTLVLAIPGTSQTMATGKHNTVPIWLAAGTGPSVQQRKRVTGKQRISRAKRTQIKKNFDGKLQRVSKLAKDRRAALADNVATGPGASAARREKGRRNLKKLSGVGAEQEIISSEIKRDLRTIERAERAGTITAKQKAKRVRLKMDLSKMQESLAKHTRQIDDLTAEIIGIETLLREGSGDYEGALNDPTLMAKRANLKVLGGEIAVATAEALVQHELFGEPYGSGPEHPLAGDLIEIPTDNEGLTDQGLTNTCGPCSTNAVIYAASGNAPGVSVIIEGMGIQPDANGAYPGVTPDAIATQMGANGVDADVMDESGGSDIQRLAALRKSMIKRKKPAVVGLTRRDSDNDVKGLSDLTQTDDLDGVSESTKKLAFLASTRSNFRHWLVVRGFDKVNVAAEGQPEQVEDVVLVEDSLGKRTYLSPASTFMKYFDGNIVIPKGGPT